MENMQGTVLVVGAGISGLTTAKELMEKGYKVTVLEASDRVGGRISTKEVSIAGKTFEFDMGAGWIRGSSEYSPLTKLVETEGNSKFVETDNQSLVIYNSKGEVIEKQANI